MDQTFPKNPLWEVLQFLVTSIWYHLQENFHNLCLSETKFKVFSKKFPLILRFVFRKEQNFPDHFI